MRGFRFEIVAQRRCLRRHGTRTLNHELLKLTNTQLELVERIRQRGLNHLRVVRGFFSYLLEK